MPLEQLAGPRSCRFALNYEHNEWIQFATRRNIAWEAARGRFSSFVILHCNCSFRLRRYFNANETILLQIPFMDTKTFSQMPKCTFRNGISSNTLIEMSFSSLFFAIDVALLKMRTEHFIQPTTIWYRLRSGIALTIAVHIAVWKSIREKIQRQHEKVSAIAKFMWQKVGKKSTTWNSLIIEK